MRKKAGNPCCRTPFQRLPEAIPCPRSGRRVAPCTAGPWRRSRTSGLARQAKRQWAAGRHCPRPCPRPWGGPWASWWTAGSPGAAAAARRRRRKPCRPEDHLKVAVRLLVLLHILTYCESDIVLKSCLDTVITAIPMHKGYGYSKLQLL